MKNKRSYFVKRSDIKKKKLFQYAQTAIVNFLKEVTTYYVKIAY